MDYYHFDTQDFEASELSKTMINSDSIFPRWPFNQSGFNREITVPISRERIKQARFLSQLRDKPRSSSDQNKAVGKQELQIAAELVGGTSRMIEKFSLAIKYSRGR
jgi:hypothetical protein